MRMNLRGSDSDLSCGRGMTGRGGKADRITGGEGGRGGGSSTAAGGGGGAGGTTGRAVAACVTRGAPSTYSGDSDVLGSGRSRGVGIVADAAAASWLLSASLSLSDWTGSRLLR